MNTNTNTNISMFLQMLPVAVFAAFSSFPAQVLAFSEITPIGRPFAFPTGQMIVSDPLPASYLFEEGSILGVTTSAYSSTVDQTDGDPFTTASGTRVRPGVAATNFLPLGTRVLIGGRPYVIEDRMNSRFNGAYRVDLWMSSREAALRHGTRYMTLEVISLP